MLFEVDGEDSAPEGVLECVAPRFRQTGGIPLEEDRIGLVEVQADDADLIFAGRGSQAGLPILAIDVDPRMECTAVGGRCGVHVFAVDESVGGALLLTEGQILDAAPYRTQG